jgi:hypothetical protein
MRGNTDRAGRNPPPVSRQATKVGGMPLDPPPDRGLLPQNHLHFRWFGLMHLDPMGVIGPGLVQTHKLVPAGVVGAGSGERSIDIHATPQVGGPVDGDAVPIATLQRLEAWPQNLAKQRASADCFLEGHDPPPAETASATIWAVLPEKSVSPPQPASATCSEPGSRQVMSRVRRVSGSK